MCGIAGIVGASIQRAIAEMTLVLAHRGPDGEGIVAPANEPFGFGHRRLSIIDLTPAGAQPMSDPSGRYWINYNGEVYNYKALRAELEAHGRRFRSQTDTEVVLAAYEAWGSRCLRRLSGMFAFAIWDRVEQSLFAARDHLGVKPFYYATPGDRLIYASEIKSILRSGFVSAEADPEALHNPWHFPASPRTGFRGIHKLPPAHYLTWRAGRTTVHRWWAIEPGVEDPGWDEAADRLDGLVKDAVRQQMTADVPVGALLSGGLDSSAIVALMSRTTSRPARTFSIVFRQTDRRLEAMDDDGRYAQLVAKDFQCDHTEIEVSPDVVNLLPKIVWHLDEPIFDPAAINTYLIAEAARQQGTLVLLSGMGADEIFGGYRKYWACLLADRYQALLPATARGALEMFAKWIPVASKRSGRRFARWGKRFLRFASSPPTERFLLADLSLSRAEYEQIYTDASRLPYDRLEEVRARRQALGSETLSYLTRMCLADTTLFLPDHNLAYIDKAAMAAGVEVRPPLIDSRIVEFIFRLADHYRIRGRAQKALFRQVASRWLPRAIVRRPKTPFGVPLRAWIRHDLREMVDDLLSERALRAQGLYNPRAVRALVQEDRAGREDHSHLIWNLLCRDLWQQTFVEHARERIDGTPSFAVAKRGPYDLEIRTRRTPIVSRSDSQGIGGAARRPLRVGAGEKRPRLLAIVQLPPPVHGVTVMNQVFLSSVCVQNAFDLDVLPVRFATSMADLGHVSFRKVILTTGLALRLMLKCMHARPDSAYFTLVPVGFAYYRDLILLAVLKTFGVPIIFHLHGRGIRSAASHRLNRMLYRWTFKRAVVIHLSPRLYSDISEFVPPERCFFVPNATSGALSPSPPKRRPESKSPPHIVFLSNMRREKGPIVLLRALGQMALQDLSFRASFAGAWVGDSTQRQFFELRARLGLEDRVQYVGPRYGPDKEKLLASASVFVFPTFHPSECFPLVVLEAMSYGLPIVATSEGAIPDMVEDGVNGFLVPQRNDEALAERLGRLLSEPAMCASMGERGRQKFVEQYTLSCFDANISAILHPGRDNSKTNDERRTLATGGH